mmetsp:Transcript_42149/g.89778  ORF Transcript_42149/g.89778 Transcript_42149/m.89778 type:complete len:208 (+) Transcript_42149:2357-2980(+)
MQGLALAGRISKILMDTAHTGLETSHHPLPASAAEASDLLGHTLTRPRIVHSQRLIGGTEEAEDGALLRVVRVHLAEIEAEVGLLAPKERQLKEGMPGQGKVDDISRAIGHVLRGHCHTGQGAQVREGLLCFLLRKALHVLGEVLPASPEIIVEDAVRPHTGEPRLRLVLGCSAEAGEVPHDHLRRRMLGQDVGAEDIGHAIAVVVQ